MMVNKIYGSKLPCNRDALPDSFIFRRNLAISFVTVHQDNRLSSLILDKVTLACTPTAAVADKIKALSFDTTASNMGQKHGPETWMPRVSGPHSMQLMH